MLTRSLLLAACLLLACGGPKPDPGLAPAASGPTPALAAPNAEAQLVVFAATSLRDAFTTLGNSFEASHAGVTITFNFAGTQELRTQLEQGAQIDVFASADQRHMTELKSAGRVADPVLFARNEPVIVVAQESAKKVHGLADLPKLQKLVIGVPEVPIGRYTLQIFERASAKLGPEYSEKALAKVVSRELNVRQVLAKIALGEADAGIVYRTDAQSLKDGKDKVSVVEIAPDLNVIAGYPIAVVTGAPHPTLAKAWVEWVRSDAGQQILKTAGFLAARDSSAQAVPPVSPAASSGAAK
jgi:molybdate transport system substrate-binding protein